MDRHWLLSNTCYGNWLPGDVRGFVGNVWDHRPNESEDDHRIIHNVIGEEYDRDIPGLYRESSRLMKGPPIQLNVDHSQALLNQFLETATVRSWQARAIANMYNHFHIVVSVADDPNPGKVLGDFKSWGTRRLCQRFGTPPSATWWTERGSKRKLPDERAVDAAINYVLYKQPEPLVTWSPEIGVRIRPTSVEP